MTSGAYEDSVALLAAARRLYEGDAAAVETIDGLSTRLAEPLRVAVAGIVKAGKSTLLNAILGEQIAPTDAGECTRIVTWYRHGVSYRVFAHGYDGGILELPFHREAGKLQIGVIVIVDVVNAGNIVAFLQKSFRKMKTNESGSTGNEILSHSSTHFFERL